MPTVTSPVPSRTVSRVAVRASLSNDRARARIRSVLADAVLDTLNPAVWEPLCRQNRESLADALSRGLDEATDAAVEALAHALANAPEPVLSALQRDRLVGELGCE